jgi:hypothetical protein
MPLLAELASEPQQLLVAAAAAALANPTQATDHNTPHNSSSSTLLAELASEAQQLLAARVALSRLAAGLPLNLSPAGCSLAEFVGSSRCQLLQLVLGKGNGDGDVLVQVNRVWDCERALLLHTALMLSLWVAAGVSCCSWCRERAMVMGCARAGE